MPISRYMYRYRRSIGKCRALRLGRFVFAHVRTRNSFEANLGRKKGSLTRSPTSKDLAGFFLLVSERSPSRDIRAIQINVEERLRKVQSALPGTAWTTAVMEEQRS